MKKIIVLLILVSMVQHAIAIGIGISPADIDLNNALKGAEYKSSITIFNTGPEVVNYSLKTSGNMGEWVSFYNINDYNNTINYVKVPGKNRTSVIVNIKIPEDTANGNYTGSIDVKSIPEVAKGEGSGQSLVIGASTGVRITVTGDQVLDGNVLGISTENIEPGNPLLITMQFQNTGNVMVKPKIAVTIFEGKNTIDNFTHETTQVKVSSIETIIAEWKTGPANIPSNYTAKVEISLNGKIIKSENLTFMILPVGTMTKSGNLTSLYLDGETVVDNMVTVRAYFMNTGQIDTPAKFRAEVYKDNKLIETLSSDELVAPRYQEIVLLSYLKLTSTGNYLIKGKVIFGGKETPLKEYSFKVSEKGPVKRSTPGFGVIIAVVAILTMILSRKKKIK
jgi:hypothetical protein